MQNQKSHFLKPWPQGVIDDGDRDEDVLNMDAFPKKLKKKKPVITYPWSLDEDAVETADSLKLAEDMVKHKLDKESVRDGGLGMIFHYDVDARERGWDMKPT